MINDVKAGVEFIFLQFFNHIFGAGIGGGDYVTKPFSLKDLHARGRARLRQGEYSAVENYRLSNTLIVNLVNLRKKIESDYRIPKVLLTAHGHGYTFKC